jgi:hypothetical protein
VAEQDDWPGTQGYEIRGRFVIPGFSDRLFLPAILRSS